MDNNFLSLIKTRRSVRTYKSEFVPSEALDAVLEAGTYAPTGGGPLLWRTCRDPGFGRWLRKHLC